MVQNWLVCRPAPLSPCLPPVSQSLQPRRKNATAAIQGTQESMLSSGVQTATANWLSAVSLAADTARSLSLGFRERPDGFPPGPWGDAAPGMLQDPLGFLESVTAQYGPVVGLVLGGQHVALVTDPVIAKDVLIDRASLFVKEGTAFFPNSSLAGNGLLVSDGTVWRRQRQLSNPAFRTAAVRTYGQAVEGATSAMLRQEWRFGGRRDVYADYNSLTLAVTVDALFGSAVDRVQAQQVSRSIATAFQFFAERTGTIALPEWVPTPSNIAYSTAVRQLDSVVYSIISGRRRQLADSPQVTGCLLDNLLAAKDDEGRGMTDLALRDELMTLLVAGQETSAILLAWTTAFLAHYPDVQRAALAEVDSVLQGALPTAADVTFLPYLEMLVLETLRLRPPAYMVGRCASADVSLQGFQLSRGMTVVVSPFIMHRDASRWDRPLDFDPSRWQNKAALDGTADSTSGGVARSALAGMGPNGSYVPFGAGPRNCIGAGFAIMETVLVLATVLQKVQMRPLPGAHFPPAEPRITLRPGSFDLILSRRQDFESKNVM